MAKAARGTQNVVSGQSHLGVRATIHNDGYALAAVDQRGAERRFGRGDAAAVRQVRAFCRDPGVCPSLWLLRRFVLPAPFRP